MRWIKKFLISLLVLMPLGLSAGKIYFLSTQLVPIEESEWFRKNVLSEFEKKYGIKTVFIGSNYGEFQDRILSEFKAGQGKIDLTAGLSSDYEGISQAFLSLDDYMKKLGVNFVPTSTRYLKIDGKTVYVPWLQTTYVFICNTKALKYLPKGANIQNLTYTNLLKWVENIEKSTGRRLFGLPAGPRGLLHRFIHGYLYPSFTGAQVIRFDDQSAVTMWKYFKKLWRYTNPESSVWEKMDTPLLSEEVWIAWDHISRLKNAIIEKPNDFIIFPAPSGPAGRGILQVLVGLGIPSYSARKVDAKKLITFLLAPEVQKRMLEGTGFMPVIANVKFEGKDLPTAKIYRGVAEQSMKKDLIVSFIPGGLGRRSGEFTKIYRDIFREIILKGKDPAKVLPIFGRKLRSLYQETGARLPYPDYEIK